MALFFSTAGLVLFLFNWFAEFPNLVIAGVSAGFGIAGATLGLAGYAVGRRKD